jgi:hypothetical protein
MNGGAVGERETSIGDVGRWGDRTEPMNLTEISISVKNGGCVGRMWGGLVNQGLVRGQMRPGYGMLIP